MTITIHIPAVPVEKIVRDLLGRVEQLDALYSRAELAWSMATECTDPKWKRKLQKESTRLWDEYYELRDQPFEHLPVIAARSPNDASD